MIDRSTQGVLAAIEAGESLLALGKPGEALQFFDQALGSAPSNPRAHLGRGLALKDVGRVEDGLAAFAAAVEIDPSDPAAHVNRAALLVRLRRYGESLTACDAALAVAPDFAPAHCNRGLALAGMDRLIEALSCYATAIALDPRYAAAIGNRGKALQMLNRHEEALACYRRLIELQPDSAQAHLNASHALLTLGRFAEGWPAYEWRKRLAIPMGQRQFACPAWSGTEPLRNKSLLIHHEQGYGDTIQFCRYAEMARAAGAEVRLLVPRKLCRLIGTLSADVKVIVDDQVPTQIDYHVPMLSLPLAFGTRVATIPATVPYLRAEPERVAHWRQRIGATGFKIGINWQGNPSSPADRGRSFPVREFSRIASLRGVRLISLQYDAGSEQLHSLPDGMHVETLGDDFNRGPDAFLDSAAAMECLDLVITSDTAVAHLAGALARPTWVALMSVPDWRWLQGRADSPWYPTLRLFRQPQRSRWDAVFDEIYAALVARLTENLGGEQA
jgi:Flp pilus assembly protein TadD